MPDARELPAHLAADRPLAGLVKAKLDHAYGSALSLVDRNAAALEDLVDALLERRALDGADVARVVRRATDGPRGRR